MCGGIHHDQRIAHHYFGTHADDRHPESPRSAQYNHPPHVPLVLRLHHRTGTALGKHPRYRSRSLAELHGHHLARPADLLRQRGSDGAKPAPHPAHQRGNPAHLRLRAHRSKLPDFAHSSSEVHAVRINDLEIL